MRLFCLATLLFPLLALPAPINAQEESAPSQVETTEQNTPDETALETEPETSIYAQATDRQIREAQRFYKYCTQDDFLKEEKDCKCAAATFLETRIKLGADASTADVMKEGEDSCFRNTVPVQSSEKGADMSEVTDAQLEEAQHFFNQCKTDKDLSKNYDCKCISANFLQKRIELGPTASEDLVFLEIQSTCPNVVETTGHAYSSCMTRAAPRGLRDIGIKDYCECIAREWSKAYERLNGQVDVSIKIAIQSKAQMHCLNPSLYK